MAVYELRNSTSRKRLIWCEGLFSVKSMRNSIYKEGSTPQEEMGLGVGKSKASTRHLDKGDVQARDVAEVSEYPEVRVRGHHTGLEDLGAGRGWSSSCPSPPGPGWMQRGVEQQLYRRPAAICTVVSPPRLLSPTQTCGPALTGRAVPCRRSLQLPG